MNYYLTKKNERNWFDQFAPFDSIFEAFFPTQNAVCEKRHKSPLVDIEKDEESYKLTAELPGFTNQDISVKIEENLLTIEASKEELKENKNDEDKKEVKASTSIIKERFYQSYKRSFELPSDIDSENISAKMENGILHLTIPRSKKNQPKLIKIDAA